MGKQATCVLRNWESTHRQWKNRKEGQFYTLLRFGWPHRLRMATSRAGTLDRLFTRYRRSCRRCGRSGRAVSGARGGAGGLCRRRLCGSAGSRRSRAGTSGGGVLGLDVRRCEDVQHARAHHQLLLGELEQLGLQGRAVGHGGGGQTQLVEESVLARLSKLNEREKR
jgi:hypothetical protein